ncbi:MAG: aldolase/citrate lyase family protein, partial [Nitrososphaerota archaeon]
MIKNRVKEKIKKGEVTYGAWVGIGHPDVAEILSILGLDWLVFDTEHAPLYFETVQKMMQAIREPNLTPITRVAWNDPVLIKLALDIGSLGIIVPWVNNKEEAIKAVKAKLYPPKG